MKESSLPQSLLAPPAKNTTTKSVTINMLANTTYPPSIAHIQNIYQGSTPGQTPHKKVFKETEKTQFINENHVVK